MPPRRRRVPFLPHACVLLACALLTACSGDGPAAGPPQGPPAAVVTTQLVGLQPWSDAIAALGTVQARESVMVTAKVSETVERVHFDSGDEVRAGAVLVTLSGNQQRAALAAALAAAEEADRLYQRQSALAAQQLVSRSLLDTQRATRDAARAQVQEIRANLGDRSIRAPFAGRLGIRRVSPGALVQPGTEIASLDDLSSVYADFAVPEAQIANLDAGQRVTATSTAFPGRTFRGEVSAVDARVDPGTRAVTVRGVFDNDDRALRPGMLLQVQLMRPEREALVVPEIAVVQVGRDSFVYRVGEDDTVEQVPVRIGARSGDRAEVIDGLAPGARIVVDGTGKLRSGMRITEAPPAPAADQSPGTAADGGRAAPGAVE